MSVQARMTSDGHDADEAVAVTEEGPSGGVARAIVI